MAKKHMKVRVRGGDLLVRAVAASERAGASPKLLAALDVLEDILSREGDENGRGIRGDISEAMIRAGEHDVMEALGDVKV